MILLIDDDGNVRARLQPTPSPGSLFLLGLNEVYYLTPHEEATARKLAECLQNVGYLRAESRSSVQLSERDGQPVVRLLCQREALADIPTEVAHAEMQPLAAAISEQVFAGGPLAIELTDETFTAYPGYSWTFAGSR